MNDQLQAQEHRPAEDADDAPSGMGRGLVVLVVVAIGLLALAFATGQGDALRQALKLVVSMFR